MGLYEDMRIFNKVCELESFSKAASDLNMSSSAVSKAIKRFEDTSGEILLNRNTQNIALTNIGKVYFDKSIGIIDSIAELSDLSNKNQVHQALKVTFCNDCQYFFQNEVLDITRDYTKGRSIIVCELSQEKAKFDLVSSRSDFYFYLGIPKESNLVARKLCSLSYSIYCPTDLDGQLVDKIVVHSSFYSARTRKLNVELSTKIDFKPLLVFDSYKDSFNYAVKSKQPVLLPTLFENKILDKGFKKFQDVLVNDTFDREGIYLCYLVRSHQKDLEYKSFVEELMCRVKTKLVNV